MYKCFNVAVVMSYVIKFIGMAVSLMFTIADAVQFLGQVMDLPDTKINRVMEKVGADIGDAKWIPFIACLLCNIIFND